MPDRTRFIVNTLLVPYSIDAIRAMVEGVADVADIEIR